MKHILKNRDAFTLVELLVVIAILSILVVLLLPVLRNAKDQAMCVACMNNLRQCGLNLYLYGEDNYSRIPPIKIKKVGLPPGIFSLKRWGYDCDLRKQLDSYADYAVWKCPVFDVPDMNDSRNTRSKCYFSYFYFPNVKYPRFGTSNLVPCKFKSLVKRKWVIMQDTCYSVNGNYRTNHDRGDELKAWYKNNNPSQKCYVDGWPSGANCLYVDGSIIWYNFYDLDNVGSFYSSGPYYVYSKLPK